ncbi:MAG: enoyl-CoA hydratase-related protein [Dehalococcoidia bacterium]|nr:enoyl-CoA hydratase-related protein [Dehalococcoidia bacterium]
MSQQYIKLQVESYVAVVTIDNPPVNAMSLPLIQELITIFESFSVSEDVRVAVLTAAGDRAFCSGRDLKESAGYTPAQNLERARYLREGFFSVYHSAVPVICVVNAPALGGGTALAGCCDFVIASERAVFGLAEIDVGLVGGAKFLSRMIPLMKARKMALTGERLGAREMYRLGGVDAVLPPEDLMSEAMKWARVIAGKSPRAVRLMRKTLNDNDFVSLKEAFRAEQGAAFELLGYEDTAEASRAVLEKRLARFTGK